MSHSHKEYDGFTFWKRQIYHFAPRDQDCKCIHKGLSQASCQGVHGLQDSDVHNTRRAMHFGSYGWRDFGRFHLFCVFLSLDKFPEVSDTLWAQCQVPSLSKSRRVFLMPEDIHRWILKDCYARPGEITPPPEAIDFIPTLSLCCIPKSKIIQQIIHCDIDLIW